MPLQTDSSQPAAAVRPKARHWRLRTKRSTMRLDVSNENECMPRPQETRVGSPTPPTQRERRKERFHLLTKLHCKEVSFQRAKPCRRSKCADRSRAMRPKSCRQRAARQRAARQQRAARRAWASTARTYAANVQRTLLFSSKIASRARASLDERRASQRPSQSCYPGATIKPWRQRQRP